MDVKDVHERWRIVVLRWEGRDYFRFQNEFVIYLRYRLLYLPAFLYPIYSCWLQESCCGFKLPNDWYQFAGHTFGVGETPDSCCKIFQVGCGASGNDYRFKEVGIIKSNPKTNQWSTIRRNIENYPILECTSVLR